MALAIHISAGLIDEYDTIVTEVGFSADSESLDREKIVTALVQSGEWTEGGAEAILSLAVNYGTFMLRNALVLASVLEIEDGALGY